MYFGHGTTKILISSNIYTWVSFAVKHLLQCSNDKKKKKDKNLRLDGFSGGKPPSSRQGPDRWLFFCAAFTLYYEESDMGSHNNSQKKNN